MADTDPTITSVSAGPTMPPGGPPGPPIGPMPGDSIGPYRIVEKLGEGGFGVVYLAEQREPVRRRVALKVLKLGMDTREVVSRFEQERQTLAVMDHPGIAKVFGAGATEQGRPYFVMEYVAGTPITHFCDKNTLSTADRIRLYIDVCRAIQHAHHKGVIHRDLKPGNILVAMVDGRPSPKIIDFGIAKAAHAAHLDRSLVTRHGQFIGTPEYMSPEQASDTEIDIDTRSDIYSLGVVLYELLTGLRPFDASSHVSGPTGDLRRMIIENAPPRPSTKVSSLKSGAVARSKQATPTPEVLDTIARRRGTDPDGLRRQLQGDLDWILMKAMEKERSRRYDSASAFGEDLQRHLNNEPVSAGPPSATYRLTKFVRRNRGPVSAGAGFVLLLAVSAAVSITLYRQADVERARAERALGTAKEAQIAAEAETVKTREAQKAAEAQAAKTKQTLAFVTDMFASVEPDNAQGREVTVRDVLEKAARTADESLKGQPEVHGFAREVIGRTYHQLGKYEIAETNERRAYELRRDALGPKDRDTLESLHNLSATQIAQAKFAEAEENLTKAVTLRREAFGENDADTLASLDLMAQLLQDKDDLAGAEKIVRGVIDARAKVLGPTNKETIGSRCTLADLMEYQGRLEEAEKYAGETSALAASSLGEEHTLTLTSQSIHASILQRMAKHAEAEAILRKIIPIKKKLYGEDRSDVWVSENALAMILRDQNKDEEAEAMNRSLVERATKVLGPEHPTTLTYMNNLAQMLRDEKKYAEAEPLYRKVIAADTRVSGSEGRSTLIARNNLGLLLMATGKPEEALVEIRACYEGFKKTLPADHWMLGLSRAYVGETLTMLKRYAEAEPEIVGGYEIVAKGMGETHPRTKQVVEKAVALYEAWGKPEKAEEWKKKGEKQ